jgi:hypothetical protein
MFIESASIATRRKKTACSLLQNIVHGLEILPEAGS